MSNSEWRNEELCRQCWEENSRIICPWDILWNEGDCCCPGEFSGINVNPYPAMESIPNFCPSGLEHIIANRQEEIDKKELTNA